MAVRKLKIECADENGCYGGAWREAVAALEERLHVADGVRFVSSVNQLVGSGQILEEPWVGVLHATPELRQLEDDRVFHANLASCQGLWVLSNDVKAQLAAWNVTVAVSLLCLRETPSNPQSKELSVNVTSPAFPDSFVAHVANNALYRRLPTPRSQAGEFRGADLTVFLISYKRVQNIGGILTSLCQQDYSGTFEVILWNNNPEAAGALEEIVAPFRSRLDLTVLHSSRNFYCIVRLAVAHLMRSELLMICDDDIQPSPKYLTTFVDAMAELGGRAVVCARGNTFQPHTLNQEAPHRVWEHWDHLDFWDVNAEPREIHFMHGSSCLVPRVALLQLASLDLPRREFILVDDYWFSYALSGLLGWRIWKIRATEAFKFDKSAEDPEVALFLNAKVREERTNFYVYHMTHGWPAGCGV